MIAQAKPEIPARIGRYEIVERIARGGMAEVLRAVMEGPGGFRREVALKRILPGYGSDPEFVRLFDQEARLAARLRHANVVQVLDFGEDQGERFLVMELVLGLDLRRALEQAGQRGRPLPIGLATFVCAEVLRGLAHAHGLRRPDGSPAGLVHRDVSPHNVLLSFAGEVKLSDFGIAKALDATLNGRHSRVRGKLGYMAPEQALGQAIDARTDLFALGVILYEVTTGVRLWGRGPEQEVLSRLLTGRFDRPRMRNPEIPPVLEDCIVRLLAPEAAVRPASAEEALRELCATDLVPSTASLDLAAWLSAVRRPATASLAVALEGGKGATLSMRALPREPTLAPTGTFEPGDTSLAGPEERAIARIPVRRRLARRILPILAIGLLAGAAVAMSLLAVHALMSRPRAKAALAGQAQRATAESVAPPRYVDLVVRVAPASAHLSIDGAAVAGTGPWKMIAESDRVVDLQASAPGYVPARLRVRVSRTPEPIDMQLVPEPPPPLTTAPAMMAGRAVRVQVAERAKAPHAIAPRTVQAQPLEERSSPGPAPAGGLVPAAASAAPVPPPIKGTAQDPANGLVAPPI